MEVHSIDIDTEEQEDRREEDNTTSKYWKNVTTNIVAFVGIFLYFFDINSDIRLAVLLGEANLHYLGSLVTLFLLLPLGLGVISLYINALNYVKAYKWETCDRGALLALCPCTFLVLSPFPYILDFLAVIYRTQIGIWPDEFINFMSEYEAQRALVEVLFESIPQSIIQTYMYVNFSQLCSSCDSNSELRGNVGFTVTIGIINVLFRFGVAVWDKLAMGISWTDYFKQIFTNIGVGLPLHAVATNKLKNIDFSLPLNHEQVRLLLEAVKKGGEVKSIRIRSKLDEAAVNVFAEHIITTQQNDGDKNLYFQTLNLSGRLLPVHSMLRVKNINADISKDDTGLIVPMTKEDAAIIAACLTVSNILADINLKGNDIGTNGAKYFSHALSKENISLKILNLYGNNIFDTGAIAMSNALSENNGLTSLNLGGNRIGPTGAVSLAQMLQENPSLTNFCLSRNAIGEKGLLSISKSMHKLKIVDLSYNYNVCGLRKSVYSAVMNFIGVEALSNTIGSKMCLLEELHFGHNNIGEKGCIILAHGLITNKRIKILDLSGNEIGNAGANSIGCAAKKNSDCKLTKVYLSRNNITLHRKTGDGTVELLLDTMNNSTSWKYLDLSHNISNFDDDDQFWKGHVKEGITLAV